MRELAYNSWKSMMARCYNESHKHYSYYGGRGIAVDLAWHDFDVFYGDMGDRVQGMSLDRIDNAKGYSVENCKWSTAKEQANNRSSNRLIDGLTIAQWADKLGCNPAVISGRLAMGWSEQEAVTKSVCKNKEVTFKGVTKNLMQWAKDTGIAYTTLVSRYNKGKTADEILKGAAL